MNNLNLDYKLNSFGFNMMEFDTLLSGGTFFGYRYKNEWMGTLIVEDVNSDQFYKYEDEHIFCYYPTERNPDSIFFFELKRKYLICENEKYLFYTNFEFNEDENYDFVIVERLSKHSNEAVLYYIMTFDYNIRWSNLMKKNKYMCSDTEYTSLNSTLNFCGLNVHLLLSFNIALLKELFVKMK